MSRLQGRTRADDPVLAGVRATYVAFVATGFTFASWASRIPQVRDELHLDPSQLGLLLLSIAVGSLVALPLSGPIVDRFGSRRTVTVLAVVDGVALATVAAGYSVGVAPVVVGLVAFGFAQGGWDVAMNVQGAVVERSLGRSIMPRFHAGFSAGTVAGAGIGAAMVWWHVPVPAHFLAVAALVVGVVPLSTRRFVPDTDTGPATTGASEGETDRPHPLTAWREPRTLLVGLFVLTYAFAEGSGNDWVGIALIDGYGTAAAVGTLGFAVFLAAMTAGRWYGPALLDRYGRVRVVRGLAVVGGLGALLFVFGAATPLAFVGVALWGVGLSLGFPVGMSAGADDPARAPARVSVVASLGYCAFLAGPPFIGFLGQQISVLRALTTVAFGLAAAFLLAGSVRPLPGPGADPEPPPGG